METKEPTKVIRRKPKGRNKSQDGMRIFTDLSDAEKYQVLMLYSEGKDYREIAKTVSVDSLTLSVALSKHIKEMTLVQETNKLSKASSLPAISTSLSPAEVTEQFKEDAQEHGLVFGYYLGLTNDSRYALKASGLDEGIPATASAKTRNYILRVRSQYLQSIPAIRAEIDTIRKREYTESSIDRPYILSEIIGQLEEEKILREDNPASRQNSIKLIKLLGDCIGAFSTTVNVREINPEDSLQALIEMAEADIVKSSYTVIEEDGTDDED